MWHSQIRLCCNIAILREAHLDLTQLHLDTKETHLHLTEPHSDRTEVHLDPRIALDKFSTGSGAVIQHSTYREGLSNKAQSMTSPGHCSMTSSAHGSGALVQHITQAGIIETNSFHDQSRLLAHDKFGTGFGAVIQHGNF